MLCLIGDAVLGVNATVLRDDTWPTLMILVMFPPFHCSLRTDSIAVSVIMVLLDDVLERGVLALRRRGLLIEIEVESRRGNATGGIRTGLFPFLSGFSDGFKKGSEASDALPGTPRKEAIL